MPMTSYRVETGMNYRPSPSSDEVRREIGDIISDLPAKAIKDLLAIHAITEVEETPVIESVIDTPAPTGEPVATEPPTETEVTA